MRIYTTKRLITLNSDYIKWLSPNHSLKNEYGAIQIITDTYLLNFFDFQFLFLILKNYVKDQD